MRHTGSDCLELSYLVISYLVRSPTPSHNYLARASILGVSMVVFPLKPTSPHPMSSTSRSRMFGEVEVVE